MVLDVDFREPLVLGADIDRGARPCLNRSGRPFPRIVRVEVALRQVEGGARQRGRQGAAVSEAVDQVAVLVISTNRFPKSL